MRTKNRRNRISRVVFRLVALIPLGMGLPGCTTAHSQGAPSASYPVPSPALVYASDAMINWETSQAPADVDRFEYARNDSVLGGGPAVALRATEQWPQGDQPIERPVIFSLFQQDRGRSAFGGIYGDLNQGHRPYGRSSNGYRGRAGDRGLRRYRGSYNGRYYGRR